MKVWCISDTHGRHKSLRVPECDMVIHCGDFSNSKNLNENIKEVKKFTKWFSNLPIQHKVCIAGNHDTSLDLDFQHPKYMGLAQCHSEDKKEKQKLKNVFKEHDFIYLENDYISIEGVKIYGSPYTPMFYDWAFMYRKGIDDVIWKTNPIDDDVDILVTHGPAKNMLDLVPEDNVNCGSLALREVIDRAQPKFHLSGHNHNSSGQICSNGQTEFLNCSMYTGKPGGNFFQGHVIEV